MHNSFGRNYEGLFSFISHGCWGTYHYNQQAMTPPPEDCLTPGAHFPERQPGAQRAVFFVGYSHAGALLPGIQKAVAGRMAFAFSAAAGWSFRSVCDPRFAQLEESVREGDVVAVAELDPSPELVEGQRDPRLHFWRNALIPMLASRGAHLVLMGDVYALDPLCTSRDCPYSEDYISHGSGWRHPPRGSGLTKRGLLQLMIDVAREHAAHVHVFNSTLDLFMANGQGSSWIPGTDIRAYLDYDHLSESGALYLAPYICAAFDSWGLFSPAPQQSPAAAAGAWRSGVSFEPGEEEAAWCNRVATQYCVRPGRSRGLLPEEAFERWDEFSCESCCPVDMGCTVTVDICYSYMG